MGEGGVSEIRCHDTGEGWSIEVDGVVVLRWDGDGICTDTIYHESPKRQFPNTTTPHWRCLRMLFEEYADVIVSALTDGPSRTELKQASEYAGTEPGVLLESAQFHAVDAECLIARALDAMGQKRLKIGVIR